MPRLHIPVDWQKADPIQNGPIFHLENAQGHHFYIHLISKELVRVVHQLAPKHDKSRKPRTVWEKSDLSSEDVHVQHDTQSRSGFIKFGLVKIQFEYSLSVALKWFKQDSAIPFQQDLPAKAYTFDETSGAVYHFLRRETFLPLEEEDGTPGPDKYRLRSEFIYGLGETTGSIVKNERKFTIEARDAVGYNMESGDPMYKLYPFYLVHNSSQKIWFGMFYNTLSHSVFDMGAEMNGVYGGSIRSFKANAGPLDYYLVIGDTTLPSVLSSYAALTSPARGQSSLTLPPLLQFGYMASTLGLCQDDHAQTKIVSFIHECRDQGFPIDGFHLSSGWCQDETTGDRNYFVWNHKRYPDPSKFGQTVEKELDVKLLVNIKPWLLESHPLYSEAESASTFVKAALDTIGDPMRATPTGNARTLLWSSGIGEQSGGCYLDFTTKKTHDWWGDKIKETLLINSVSGMWIDNNEFSEMVDDDERFSGEVKLWDFAEAEQRLGMGSGMMTMGQVGRGVQTMGMAKATYSALLKASPDERPTIVTRSAVPGIQAYAHGTWSGDNITTWQVLKRSIALTISIGLSFGPGLYGHDVGGFEGPHNPSAELLIRWVQQGIWHTRFVVHSNKPITTTLWMYEGEPTDIIREAVQFRYRLIPTLYSFYVDHWQRKGWPVIKPILWYHSEDHTTLTLDEQFIFGSHILVAPVAVKGARTQDVYLPQATDGKIKDYWCELDTGIWHETNSSNGVWIKQAAPLHRIPTLIRAGGIFILGGACKRGVMDGLTSRTALIFPAPEGQSQGFFRLVEDDGVTNQHTTQRAYCELLISFETDDGDTILIDVEIVHNGYKPPYEIIWFIPPQHDNRKMAIKPGKVRHQQKEGGRDMVGIEVFKNK